MLCYVMLCYVTTIDVNPFPAELIYLNFYPLEVGGQYYIQICLFETKHLQIVMFKYSFHSQ